MRGNRIFRKWGLLTLTAVSIAGLAACSGGKSANDGKSPVELLNVSYDPTRELYEAINPKFAADWKAKNGQALGNGSKDEFQATASTRRLPTEKFRSSRLSRSNHP